MSTFKKVFIFGYSGHAYVIIESLLDAGYMIEGYFDLNKSLKNPYNLNYLGNENNENLKSIIGNNYVFPAVGSNLIRKKMVDLFEKYNLNETVIIDPTAKVSKTSTIDKSTYIGKNVNINAQAKIGKGVIINTNALVEHECVINNFVHLAPSSVLCGHVEIGNHTFVGSNSVIKENLTISSDVIVGAGSVIIKSIIESGTWFGNPAKKYEK